MIEPHNTSHSCLYGLVLSGGRSTRMGSDKGLLNYHGKNQREFLFELLSKNCEKVFTSCNSEQNIPSYLNPLTDQFQYKSPINGILTALSTAPETGWIIVAVDMPHVTQEVIELLISNRNEDLVATCFFNHLEKFPEPLLTIWEPKALPLLSSFVETERISPRAFLQENKVQLVSTNDERIFVNVNTPNEYNRVTQASN